MKFSFYELSSGNGSSSSSTSVARIPVKYYTTALSSSASNSKTAAQPTTMPWILITLTGKNLLCRAVPAVNDDVSYVEAVSNMWIPTNENAVEDKEGKEEGRMCTVSGLIPRSKLAERVVIEAVDEKGKNMKDFGGTEEGAVIDFTALMRATLVHRPVCKGVHFECFNGKVFKVLSFESVKVQNQSQSQKGKQNSTYNTKTKEEEKDDVFVMVAPQTIFVLSDKVLDDNFEEEVRIPCPPGLEGPFSQIRDLLDPFVLKQMRSVGLEMPRGVLMSGPPGVGKTFLVRHIAKNSNISLSVVNGPELISPVPGESEANLERVFSEARAAARNHPLRCSIIFFDEIDAIARKREDSRGESIAEVRLLTQLLVLMDGYEGKGRDGVDVHVIVMAATNRPNSLDPAMRRPGRFDREIVFEPPDALTRAILLKHLISDRFELESGVDLDEIARNCNGYVSSDLVALIREVTGEAFDSNNCCITRDHFVEGMKRVGPSLHRQYQVALDNRVTWSDIAGIDSIKSELRRYIEWPLIHPDAYKRMGIPMPRGVLLYGPPGCSKTTIAKAIANESKFSFYSLNGAALYSCYVGESEQQIRDIFQCARMTAPSVIFFDEIDAIVGKRSQESGVGSDDPVQERILSTLLNEMDGICSGAVGSKNVLVVGATNRKDLIDSALLRPGRFDRHVYIPLPDEQGRKEILELFLKDKPQELTDFDVSELARITLNYSGADLKGLVQEAAILAMHDKSFTFKRDHFDTVLSNPGRQRS